MNSMEKNEIISKLSELVKAIADTEDINIVRCFECQHFVNHDKRCKHFNHGVDGLDYCSNGKKKFTNYLN